MENILYDNITLKLKTNKFVNDSTKHQTRWQSRLPSNLRANITRGNMTYTQKYLFLTIKKQTQSHAGSTHGVFVQIFAIISQSKISFVYYILRLLFIGQFNKYLAKYAIGGATMTWNETSDFHDTKTHTLWIICYGNYILSEGV